MLQKTWYPGCQVVWPKPPGETPERPTAGINHQKEERGCFQRIPGPRPFKSPPAVFPAQTPDTFVLWGAWGRGSAPICEPTHVAPGTLTDAGVLTRRSCERQRGGDQQTGVGGAQGGDWGKNLDILWGTWVAQSVKPPTSAQVMISQFMGSSPALGSMF